MSSINLSNFFKSNHDGVYYVGHASILVRLNGKYILFDPAGSNKESFYYSWLYYPEQNLSNKIIDKIDYVIISHIHKDHLDPIFLKKLDSKTKILIFDIDTLKRELDNMSIDYKIINHKGAKICNDIKICGFLNNENKVDSSSIIYTDNFCVYHGNDNWAPIEEINKKMGNRKINVSCVPFAFVYWYPYLFRNMSNNNIKKESKRLVSDHFEYAVNFAKKVDTDIIIPFGSNLIHNSSMDSLINVAVKNPLEFKDYVDKNHAGISCKIFPLFADDVILFNNNSYEIKNKQRTVNSIKSEMNDFIKKNKNSKRKKDFYSSFKRINNKKMLEKIKSRVKEIPKINSKLYIVSNKEKSVIFIDFLKQNIKIYDHLDKNIYNKKSLVHIFELDELGTKLYFSGNVCFEDILGSRFFKVFRNSDHHCKRTFSFLCQL
jgi:hypothetical protein